MNLYRPGVSSVSAWLFVSATVLAVNAAEPETHNGQPNILFILTDDQRWDSVGASGNDLIHTPNLDRICDSGTRFRNAFRHLGHLFTQSSCLPYRTIRQRQWCHFNRKRFGSTTVSRLFQKLCKPPAMRQA